MPNNENGNLKGEDDSPSAAAGSEALWETTTTLKEDLEAGFAILERPIRTHPIVVGPLLFERLKKENKALIESKP